MPLSAALLIAAAGYLLRGIAKGFDFSPDLPLDAVVLVMLLAVIGIVAWSRAETADDRSQEDPSSEGQDEEGQPAQQRHPDDISEPQ